MNRVQLEASIVELGSLRYTPAGIPVQDCVLAHAGQVNEAGIPRHVEFSIPAIALGEIGKQVAAMGLARDARFVGFLARKHRNSRTLVFHITAVQEIEKD